MKWFLALAVFFLTAGSAAADCSAPVALCPHDMTHAFALIRSGVPASVLTDQGADPAVLHAADGFAEDLERVSGRKAPRAQSTAGIEGPVVIVGVLGQSPIIDSLVAKGKIHVADITGAWEAYRQIVVDNPVPGIDRALVIVGSDRRGAVFGTYDISEKIGVSPLYWFADVPVKKRTNVFLTAGERTDRPKVKYRGIFINDEAPAFSTWTEKKFGGANAKAYAHIFELILRMKGNYLWPAMWSPRAFNADDPENYKLADAMGVVMGTSHHEPMMRAYEEWHRNTDKGVTGGKWDYSVNAANLRTFWRGGIERMMSKGKGQNYESVVTVGMRGDGDEPMAEGTAAKLLETIVADQRRILAEVTGKPANRTPQVWALYKEVQDYYDHGMRVPDDVTLLFADDNWGQIRRLPTHDAARAGGYGVYYHFDYVGSPRNYKWIDTVQIEKTWQQMDLAYARGARALWVVNVGDIKPLEYPIAFFLKMAWDPEAMTADALGAYPHQWAETTFGPEQAETIGRIVTRYGQLAARRKPELLDAASFPLGEAAGLRLNGGVFGKIVAEWDDLERETRALETKLSPEQQDAYFEMIEHPVLAMANLYRLYYWTAWNRRLGAAGDARANTFADWAQEAFARDQALSARYHRIAGGKWDGMMLQTHIGHTTWQQPDVDALPKQIRVAGAKVLPVFEPPTVRPNAIAIEAAHFSRSFGAKGLSWHVLPHLGQSDAVIALPQGRPATTTADGVRLEYDLAQMPANVRVRVRLSPTLDTTGSEGLKIGLSLDDGPVQTLRFNLIPAPNNAKTPEQKAWVAAVIANEHVLGADFQNVPPGRHTLKLWRIDDNVVVEKIEIANP